MATNADQIIDQASEDASDWALADVITNIIHEEPGARERGPDGRFVGEKSEDAPAEAEAKKDASPKTVTGETKEAEADPAEPVIDPPDSWTAEYKARFGDLPRDLQLVIANRDAEQKATFNRQITETAESRKKYESEAQATQQERQRYAETMTALQSYAQTMDPIVAEGMRTDWTKASQEDPIGTQTKWFAYQQRMQMLNAIQQESHRVNEANAKAARDDARKRLTEAYPDFADDAKAKAKRDALAPILLGSGFSQAEITGILDVPDPRILRVLDEALEGRALKAAQKTLASKKVAPEAVKVAKPRASDDGKQPNKSQRLAALEKRALKTDSPRDLANWIAAQIEENPQ